MSDGECRRCRHERRFAGVAIAHATEILTENRHRFAVVFDFEKIDFVGVENGESDLKESLKEMLRNGGFDDDDEVNHFSAVEKEKIDYMNGTGVGHHARYDIHRL